MHELSLSLSMATKYKSIVISMVLYNPVLSRLRSVLLSACNFIILSIIIRITQICANPKDFFLVQISMGYLCYTVVFCLSRKLGIQSPQRTVTSRSIVLSYRIERIAELG